MYQQPVMHIERGTSRLVALMNGPRLNVGLLLSSVIISMLIGIIILGTMGLSAFIGVICIIYAGIALLLNRGKFLSETVIIILIIGVAFLVLHYVGVDMMVIDFQAFGPTNKLYELFHQR